MLDFQQSPPLPKRIILVHTKGRLAGLHRIVGTDDQLQAALKVQDLPEYIPVINFIDHQSPCGLFKVNTRGIYYREIMEPITSQSNFHPEQQ